MAAKVRMTTIKQRSEEPTDFDAWFEAEGQDDPYLAGTIEDTQARANLLIRMVAHRHECGLSQAAVAEAMETSQSAVSDLEGGTTDPRLSTLQRYTRALGCRLRINVEPAIEHGWISVPYHFHGAIMKELPSAGWTTTYYSDPIPVEQGFGAAGLQGEADVARTAS
ncbi:MAG TPA: helix-turn-helix transcriptional regulator [Acidimicrobiales bacterium]|jgi:transcriptional regulator with XRE-family HTH domain|nr:helix-turn-helix transcriptional regulator [Acidimicrobiales bacterium]